MMTMIITVTAERFGTEAKNLAKQVRKNRLTKTDNIEKELKALKKHKLANHNERAPLEQLHSTLRKRLITLRRAEQHQRDSRD